MYADDIDICSRAVSILAAKYRIQTALDHINSWSGKWAVKINMSKTKYTIFSLSPNMSEQLNLKLINISIAKENNPTYLVEALPSTTPPNLE